MHGEEPEEKPASHTTDEATAQAQSGFWTVSILGQFDDWFNCEIINF